MPPSDYGSSGSYDTAYVDPFPGEYVPRFARDQLDAAGQKIFDQLKDQKAQLEKKLGASEVSKYYTTISGLTPDESLAMMAAELQSTGITDIYKVKQDTQRIPVQEVWAEHSEGGTYNHYYLDPSGREIPNPSTVKGDARSGFYVDQPIYTNTETGQPLVTSVGRGEFQNDPGILTDMAVGKRQFSGTGLKFTDDGVPFYYSTGFKKDSNITSFLKGAAPVLGMAAGLLAGPAGLKLGALASGAIGGGVSGLFGSGGELDEALKSAALGAAMAYGKEAVFGALPSTSSAFDITDVVPAQGVTYDPRFPPSGPSYNYVDDLFSGAGAPTPDVVYPGLFPSGLGDPTSAFGGMPEPAAPPPPTLPDFSYDDMVPPSALPGYEPSPEWNTGYPTTTEVPNWDPDYGPAMDPSLGDPTAGYGGMPKTPNFLEETLAGLGAGAKALLGTPGGRLLLSGIVTTLAANKSPSGPGTGTGSGPQGWSGDIPKFQAVRERVPLSDAGRRPGEYGRRYFSDTAYVPLQPGEENLGANIENVAAAKGLAQLQAQELAKPPVRAATGGLMGLAKGRYLNGTTDGMEDKLPANIDGQQPARLSHGEFVIPADVVSHLGNGNSQAGAKRLYEMMDKIRHARTGTKKQGRQINADKYLPV